MVYTEFQIHVEGDFDTEGTSIEEIKTAIQDAVNTKGACNQIETTYIHPEPENSEKEEENTEEN